MYLTLTESRDFVKWTQDTSLAAPLKISKSEKCEAEATDSQ